MTPLPICRTSGKRMFDSARDAKASRSNPKARREAKRVRSYAYRCPDCHHWHLTRVPPEKHRRGRAA